MNNEKMMSSKPLVSVVIPAYNVEDYIRECVDSVLNQSYENIEIIVVDDGSTDSTPGVADSLKSISDKVKVLHKSNGGLSSARNYGLKNANGEYVLFLDSDDWLELDACRQVVELAEENNADVVFFDYYRDFPNRRVPYYAYSKDILFFEKGKKEEFWLYDMRTITAWGKLYSRKSLGDHLFDEKMRMAEDVEYNYRVYSNVTKAVYLRQCLLHYRIRSQSAVHGYDAKILDKFEYPLNCVKMLMKPEDEDLIFAYYSFCAIAFLVVCQNQVCQNRSLSFWAKTQEIRKIADVFGTKNLFAHYGKVKIPYSRKFLILCAKLKLFFVVNVVISMKCLLNR